MTRVESLRIQLANAKTDTEKKLLRKKIAQVLALKSFSYKKENKK